MGFEAFVVFEAFIFQPVVTKQSLREHYLRVSITLMQ